MPLRIGTRVIAGAGLLACLAGAAGAAESQSSPWRVQLSPAGCQFTPYGNVCSATLSGSRNRAITIESVSCIVYSNNGALQDAELAVGGALVDILPVASRATVNAAEAATVRGATRITLGETDTLELIVKGYGSIGAATCVLSGSKTKL